MQINKIYYPHRIPFSTLGKCDVCTSPGEKIYSLPFSKYLGLVCCSDKNCSNTLKISMQKTTIPLDKLVEKYGEDIKIKRSDGTEENGWKIISYAYKLEDEENFWLYVGKDRKTKCIRVSDLL